MVVVWCSTAALQWLVVSSKASKLLASLESKENLFVDLILKMKEESRKTSVPSSFQIDLLRQKLNNHLNDCVCPTSTGAPLDTVLSLSTFNLYTFNTIQSTSIYRDTLMTVCLEDGQDAEYRDLVDRLVACGRNSIPCLDVNTVDVNFSEAYLKLCLLDQSEAKQTNKLIKQTNKK